jgi:nucleoside-diphosphate-sugar epimerase
MVRALTAADYFVVPIDIEGDGDTVVRADALDFFKYGTARFDLAVHCAAVVGGRAHIDGSPLGVATNAALDAWYFRWGTLRADRMVYFSSSAAYPVRYQQQHTWMPLAEKMLDPRHPFGEADNTYGQTKLYGEYLAQVARSEGAKVYIFRPFSGCGSDQEPTYPVPAICDRVARREDPLTVWSDAYRDFIHIDDIVAAVMACLAQGAEGPLNLCTGVPTSFTTLARRAAEIAGYRPEIEVLSDMPTGVHTRVGDPTLMRRVYEPRIGLDGILSSCITHERKAA